MNYCASCEVKRAEVAQPPVNTPYPMSHGVVNKGSPEKDERHKSRETHSFCKSSGNQSWCYYCKHHLKYHECLVRNCWRIIRIRSKSYPFKTDPIQVADKVAYIRSESQAIAPDRPLQADEYHCKEAVHNGAQNILLTG